MLELTGRIAGWLVRKLGLLAVIIALILVAGWLRGEWAELRAVRAGIAQQESALQQLRSQIDALDRAIATEKRRWREQVERATRPLRAELESVQARVAQAEPKWQQALSRFADIDEHARASRKAADAAHLEAQRLAAGLRWWDRYLDPVQVASVEAARQKARVLEAHARSWERARDEVAPLIERSPVAALNQRTRQLQQDLASVSESLSPREAQLRKDRDRNAREATALENNLAQSRARAARDPRERLISAVLASLPLALSILAGVLLAPPLLKSLCYYVLAPLAERLPPTRILARSTTPSRTPPVPHVADSTVSLPIDLAPDQELLLQPDFLQSSSGLARKDTQWLLNGRLPFASLAAGLYALTRIRPVVGVGTQVVVASRRDAFGELALVDLAPGASMVVLPRALAGVVKPAAGALQVSRHWQLAELQSWLTLRLRHLVFHGPCRLIIKGRRGVRAEQPRANQPRIINQAATLAFSADLERAVTRCETFVSYLRGQDSLFNDLFSGGPGVFVHEVAPADQQERTRSRGLEGFIDAALKSLGI